jgi:hypothetical protein
MNEKEKDLAICQMHVLYTVFSWGGMNLKDALRDLDLLNKECLRLAQTEGMDWIAEKIQEEISDS